MALFINLLKHELKRRDDRLLWDHGAQTGVLFHEIRAARNDMIHTFYYYATLWGSVAAGVCKASARKSRAGQADMRTVAM